VQSHNASQWRASRCHGNTTCSYHVSSSSRPLSADSSDGSVGAAQASEQIVSGDEFDSLRTSPIQFHLSFASPVLSSFRCMTLWKDATVFAGVLSTLVRLVEVDFTTVFCIIIIAFISTVGPTLNHVMRLRSMFTINSLIITTIT